MINILALQASIFGVIVGLSAFGYLVWQGVTIERMRRSRIAIFCHRERVEVSNLRTDFKRRQIQNKLKALAESKKLGRTRIGAVRLPLMQAGVEMTLGKFWSICGIIGFAASMAYVVTDMPPGPGLAPLVFIVVTILIPKIWLGRRAKKRQRAFTKNFPDAVDILVRGLKSGLPVGECFRIISRECPAPIGPEFMVVIDQVYAGLSLTLALESCYDRVPTQEMRFFATVIAVQEQTGGNLAEILNNISTVLRGRAQLRQKAKALAGEAVASASIIGCLPFLIAGILFFVNRPYLSTLWLTTSGHFVFGLACVMMTIGVTVMLRMGKVD